MGGGDRIQIWLKGRSRFFNVRWCRAPCAPQHTEDSSEGRGRATTQLGWVAMSDYVSLFCSSLVTWDSPENASIYLYPTETCMGWIMGTEMLLKTRRQLFLYVCCMTQWLLLLQYSLYYPPQRMSQSLPELGSRVEGCASSDAVPHPSSPIILKRCKSEKSSAPWASSILRWCIR